MLQYFLFLSVLHYCIIFIVFQYLLSAFASHSQHCCTATAQRTKTNPKLCAFCHFVRKMSSGVYLADVLEASTISASAAAYFTCPVAHGNVPQLVTVRGNTLEVHSVHQVSYLFILEFNYIFFMQPVIFPNMK